MEPLRILIVDDDNVLLNLLNVMITRICPVCQVISASDGQSALAELQQSTTEQAFDLLLTDYQMPSMDGLELARTAKRVSPETKIVLMTGFVDIATILTEIERINLAGLLLKPFNREELKQALQLEP